MSKFVLDSSAILAMIYQEPGATRVLSLLHSKDTEPMVSSVNVCEVHTRLLRDGISAAEAAILLAGFELDVRGFDEADAYSAGELYAATKAFGLSLGDRACLALAIRSKVPVWTADRVWKKLTLPVAVELIRL